ncbi:hypothetical protein V1527DRAFT_476987 [Lipomyces starkeyi]
MEFRTLLDALRLICTLLPNDDDAYHIHVANQQCDGRRLTSALLNHGRCPNSIADNLWHHVYRVNQLSTFLITDGVSSLVEVTSLSGRISPSDGVTWQDAAVEFSQSKELMRIMLEWATKIFENLLFPIRRYGLIPKSWKSSSSTRRSNSSRDSNVRLRILARDGEISPVGRAVDESAPEDVLDSFAGRIAKLEAAHIMPFMLSNHSTMQTLLSMFAGTNMEAIIGGKSINSTRNIFCTDSITHLNFDEFVIGVEYLNGQYRLRKVEPRRARGPFMSQCQEGEEVIFGLGPQGYAIDLPDGELFNIHLAIANVLHASGAGEIINKVIQDEEDYNDGLVEDEAYASRILAFSLKMSLKRLQDHSTESPPGGGGDGNKRQEGGVGILRVTTNSQIDA